MPELTPRPGSVESHLAVLPTGVRGTLLGVSLIEDVTLTPALLSVLDSLPHAAGGAPQVLTELTERGLLDGPILGRWRITSPVSVLALRTGVSRAGVLEAVTAHYEGQLGHAADLLLLGRRVRARRAPRPSSVFSSPVAALSWIQEELPNLTTLVNAVVTDASAAIRLATQKKVLTASNQRGVERGRQALHRVISLVALLDEFWARREDRPARSRLVSVAHLAAAALGDPALQAGTHLRLALSHASTGNLQLAVDSACSAQALYEQLRNTPGRLECAALLAEIRLAQGELTTALSLASGVVEGYAGAAVWERARAQVLLGRCQHARGDHRAALASFTAAAGLGVFGELERAELALYRCRTQLAHHPNSSITKRLEEAETVLRRNGSDHGLAEVQLLRAADRSVIPSRRTT
ncbi:hypothetical protein [Allokutzneria multivorans]